MSAPARSKPHTRPDATGLYEPLETVLVRAPVLPVDAYLTLDADTDAAALDGRVLAALAVGGGDLSRAVRAARDGGATNARVRRKLHRYLTRMSTRPTPYGLFAAVGLGHRGERTDLALGASEPRTRTRPDMAWLMEFVAQLEQRAEIRRALRFRANTAACLQAGRLFLGERAVIGGEEARRDAVSLRATRPVTLAMELARQPCRWTRLADEICRATGAHRDKVDSLLTELWRQTLLLSELRPPLTCHSPARYVADCLRDIPAAQEAHAALDQLLDRMAAWDAAPLQEKARRHSHLVAAARTAGAGIEVAPLQVDSALGLTGRRIAASVLEEAVRAAELLLRLGPGATASPLEGYRRTFVGRYGSEREVPLLELLDPDAGLGPATPSWGPAVEGDRSARRDRLLWEIAVEAMRDRQREIMLDDATLAVLQVAEVRPDALPPSLDLAVFVLADSSAAIDAGDFRLLVGPNLGAQAAGRNLGRFADLLGAEAKDALAIAARAEERCRPAELAAELVYLPARARSANVAIRPAIRSHEIVVGTTPGVPPHRVIAPDELVVGVRGDRFYVRWARRGAEVGVHTGHMLNSMHAPALCRFLEQVAHDRSVALSSFEWGSAARLPYLPRVRAGRIVLRPARWRIDVEARDRELTATPQEDFASRLAAWRSAWAAPRHVYLSMGDNRLLIDLSDPAQADQLRQELRHVTEQGAVVLEEALPDPNAAWLTGPDGRYATELVISMARRAGAVDPLHPPSPPRSPAVPPATRAARLRPPGSDWLFLKLYGPRAAEDDLIAGPVRSIGEFALAKGLVTEWFFLRYADPEPHLRLRLRGDPETLLRHLLPELCQWAAGMVEHDRCTRFAFDTYEREVERYGGEDATAVAESVFAADSRAVAELLDTRVDWRSSLDSTALVVLSVDDMLGGLGQDEHERLAWYDGNVTTRHESGDEYRRRSDELRRLVGEEATLDELPGGEQLRRVLATRRAALEPLGERLRALAAAQRLQRPVDDLYRGYVHMHVNRLLGQGAPSEDIVLGLLQRTREGLRRAPLH